MIRILHIVPELDGGGIENLLLNYYKHMNRDKFIFDFIVHGNRVGILESDFQKMNSKVFHIPTKHESIKSHINTMKKIIKNGNYDVIHAHQGTIGAIPMYYAKRAGIKIRITHNHMAYMEESITKKIVNLFLLPLLKKTSTHWFACSLDAGRFLWGNKAVEQGKVIIMKNAIDINKFAFNSIKRSKIRKELGIEGKFVIGCVGRLSYQKNHEFLINIFEEIYKKNKNSVLLLVGRGELEEEIKEQVKNLDLVEAVRFLGVRDDVADLLCAMDVFLLPTRYEGLGIVYIEAQASGIETFGSSIVVPNEAKVTELMHFIQLEKTYESWADEVLKYNNKNQRDNINEELKKAGYDIKIEAKKLELLYMNDKK